MGLIYNKASVIRFGVGGLACKAKGWTMKTVVIRFLKNEEGATAIEYGLIAAGISVAIIAVVQSLGSSLNTTFTSVATALK